MQGLTIVIRDLIDIADDHVSRFCCILVYQNDELLDAENVSWDHLGDSEFLNGVLG